MNRRDFIRSSTTSLGLLGVAGGAGAVVPGPPVDPVALDPPYPNYPTMGRAYAAHVGYGQVVVVHGGHLDLAIGERAGARVRDAYNGRWYWDCHRVGSLYNLGHLHPQVLQAVRDALVQLEVGNGHFLSGYKAFAAEKLAASTNGQLPGVIYAASGSEATEAAIKAARGYTRRRGIVTVAGCYHGHTGLAIAANGDDFDRNRYLMSYPAEFSRVPYNDLAAMDAAVGSGTAAVLVEALVASSGFAPPDPGYFSALADLCHQRGALLVLDEVITGLGATGSFWFYQQENVVPDIITTAKGLGGGLMTNAAALLSEPVYDWFASVFMGHQTTFGGNELGCVATAATIDVVSAPGFLARVQQLSTRFADGFAGAPFGLTGRGLCLGIVLPEPRANEAVKALFDAGVLVLNAGAKPILQFRPPLILSDAEADEIIDVVRTTLTDLIG